MLALIAALLQQDPGFARAESLLAARNLAPARSAAERLIAANPTDAAAHLLLGQVWYAWPTIGRYQALDEFRTAAQLAPANPEPLYWQVKVGDYLGSDEGEVLIREAIIRIFALDPDYRDCWERFAQLYHDGGIWRRAERALATHPDDPRSLEHRAEIALALEEPGRADSLAAEVLARRRPDLPAYLARAQAAFLDHRDTVGEAWYDSALVFADFDSTGVLWDQVWMIASPEETARQDATPPGERRKFFEWFWSQRDPNLVTRANERIAEHFRRLAEVRRLFRLLHPLIRFQRSRTYRALAATYLHDAVLALAASDSGLDKIRPSAYPFADPLLVNDAAGPLTAYARANLSARGLIWLRHGRPDFWDRERGDFFDVHEWTYYSPDGPLTIDFTGIPGALGAHGDYIVAPPLNPHQARQVQTLVTTDGTKIPAPLVARGWSAFFKSPEPGGTDVYLQTAPDTAAAVLWTAAGDEVARVVGPGLLQITAPPGRYRFGLDVDSAGVLGRLRQQLRLPAYSLAALGLSSLVLAPGDSVTDRESTLRGMPADLVFPAGRSLAAYTEIYGLSADAQGRARYMVRYTFAPARSFPARLLGGGSPVEFEFTREAPARGMMPERIVLEPGRVPPGRYRVTLAVTDLAPNVKSQTAVLEITIR
jgi:GWxTD domain-containing protein